MPAAPPRGSAPSPQQEQSGRSQQQSQFPWLQAPATTVAALPGLSGTAVHQPDLAFLGHPLAEVAKQFEADEAAGKVQSWMVPTRSKLPEFKGPAIEVVSLDDELDAAE